MKKEEKVKFFKSPDYNFLFKMDNGFFARWGKTQEDDPEYAPSPELLDIEISTICHKACSWCYKANTAKGKNMSFETFKIMFDKFPKETLTQIAFGIGSIAECPDLWKIMSYCRENGVIPNVTINGDNMTPELYDKLVNVCGAVAVSHYDDDTCYNAVKELTDRGMKQCNIHQLLAEETYDQCLQVLADSKSDPRLKNLGAVVFLWLKPKGKRNTYHQLKSMDKFKVLIDKAIKTRGKFGFDSCTAPTFLKAVEGKPNFEIYKTMSESCESFGLFSGYINVDARYFPCSFAEGVGEWKDGLDVLSCNDFVRDVWFNPLLDKYRKKSLANIDCNGCRKCLIYDLGIEK